MKKWMTAIFFVVMVGGAIYAVIPLAFAIIAFTQLQEAASEVQSVIRNWQLMPVMDLELVNGSSCPAGLELARKSWETEAKWYSKTKYEKAWSRYEGSVAGCNCFGKTGNSTHTIPNPNQLSAARCDMNETRVGCIDVAGYAGTDVGMWRGRLICVRRGTVSALSRSPPDGGKCAAGPLCGPTSGRPYCPGSSKCPLTDIAIQPSAPTGSWEELGSLGSTKMWGKRSGGQPIIEFSVMPCFSLAHVLSASSELSKQQKAFCSSTNDPRWRRNIDKTVHSSVVRDNMGAAKTNAMTNQVPSHASNKGPCAGGGATCYSILGSSADLWELSYKPEIMWKTKCQTDVNPGGLKERRDPILEVTVWQNLLLTFTILNFLVMTILVCLTSCNYCCGVDLPCWSGTGEEEYEKMQRHKKYCSFCCKAVTFPISLLAMLGSQSVMGFFEEVSQHKCSDSETNKHIDTLAEGINKVYSSNRNAMIMTLISFAAEFVLLLVGWVRSAVKSARGTKVEPVEE